jgi:aryl-alcohol dehydrogenase-like predicted oxidoreductase
MGSNPSALDRRKFLQLGMMTTGAALGCGAPVGEVPAEHVAVGMRYRTLGKTGLRVSEVSFGAHGLDNPSLMEAAIEAGITTFATSGNYLDGREEAALGQAMQAVGTPRDDLVVLTGNPLRPGDTRKSILDDVDASLRRLRTDHIDVYCTGEVCSPSDLHVDALFTAMDEAKRAGKVGHLALAGHCGGMQQVLEAAIDDGRFDLFFVKYDFVSYPDQDAILRRAQEKGIGTIVFKTNAGAREQEIRDLEAGGLSFRQATVKWALTNPYVSSVCVTMTSFSQIREFAAVASSSLSRAEWGMLSRYAEEMYDRYCRFCGTCEQECPHEVAVADVMRYEMYFTSYGRQKEAMSLYASLPRERTARACVDCAGACEGSCPFGRRIRDGLREAHATLSFA